jgi:hypothetical protein
MSLVFQNIDPPPPSPPGECVPPAFVGGGGGEDTLAWRRGGGGSKFWKTRDIGLPSYSNNLSTPLCIVKHLFFLQKISCLWKLLVLVPHWPRTINFMTLDRCISLLDLKSKITTIGGFCWGRGGGVFSHPNRIFNENFACNSTFFLEHVRLQQFKHQQNVFYPLFREARAREGKLTGCYIAYVFGWWRGRGGSYAVGYRESRLGQREGKARLDNWGHVYISSKLCMELAITWKPTRPEGRKG